MRNHYIYHRPETNQDETVDPWLWTWEAHYIDSSILRQQEESDGSFHQLREIDQPQLHFFRTINRETGRFFDILWHPKRKLISGILHNRLENDTVKVDLYYFGYQTQIQGINHTVINVILPDGNIIVTEDVGRIAVT